MFRLLMIAAAIILGGLTGWFILTSQKNTPAEDALTLKVPEFSYTSLSGEVGEISMLKGKVVLLHFWASWCAPCVKEFPALLEIATTNSDVISILAFSVDDSPKEIEAFIKGKIIPANFTLIWDKNKQISKDLFQTVNYPETILVGCEGVMKDKIIGMAQNWQATLAPLLADCAQ